MKLLISIVVGILGYASITALTAAALAVVFNAQYNDIAHSGAFIAVSLFIIIPTAFAIGHEVYEVITNYLDK